MGKNRNKTQDNYTLKQSKAYVEEAKLLAALSRGENQLRPKTTWTLRTPNQKLLGFMLFAYTAIALTECIEGKPNVIKKRAYIDRCGRPGDAPAKQCEATQMTPLSRGEVELTIDVGNQASPETDCLHIADQFSQLAEKLPGSAKVITRLVKQDNFTVACINKNQMGNPKAIAQYSQRSNRIEYPAETNSQKKTLSLAVKHHEDLHADTARRHLTKFCHPKLLSNALKLKITKGNTDLIWNTLSAPIFPPTEENLEIFYQLIKADLEGEKVTEFRDLHRKNYQGSLNSHERYTYRKYLKALEGALILEDMQSINISPENLRKQLINNKVPSELIDDSGVVFHHVAWSSDQTHLEGLPKDVGSTFLMNCVAGLWAYDNYKSKGRFYLFAASAELDTYTRMGLPDSAVQLFFPRLTAHLQREEDCCDNGNVTACRPFK